ncbi:hypothetical protein KCP77_18725 [Salmonella enterica subsp. enterica]|nr:hypothetical protein KCP77_18725 [Salmonella enterica subsp. enterica]
MMALSSGHKHGTVVSPVKIMAKEQTDRRDVNLFARTSVAHGRLQRRSNGDERLRINSAAS